MEKDIDAGAEKCARRYRLDPVRVREVFSKLRAAKWFEPDFPRLTDFDRALTLRSSPKTDVNKVLEFFEKADLPTLRRRVGVYEYLMDPLTPFFSLNELAQHAQTFSEHLRRHRNELVQTGYLGKSCSPAPWFEWHFTPLWPTKLPCSVQGNRHWTELRTAMLDGMADKDKAGNLVYSYRWATELPAKTETLASAGEGFTLVPHLDYSWRGDQVVHGDGKPLPMCDYEQSPLIQGLTCEDATRLAACRLKFLDAQVRVLDELVLCIQKFRRHEVWGRCLPILNVSIGEEIDLLIRIEELYHDAGIDGYLGQVFSNIASLRMRPFGLRGLFLVIGHVEEELTIGTYRRSREKLNKCFPRQMKFFPSWYFPAIGQSWQDSLDRALDNHVRLEEENRRFWREFRGRINKALEMFPNLNLLIESIRRQEITNYVTTDKLTPANIVLSLSSRERVPKLEEIEPFPTPPGAGWEDVRIHFIDPFNARIMVKGGVQERSFAGMGFKDRRGKEEPGKPNRLWEILRLMTKSGQLSPPERDAGHPKLPPFAKEYLKDPELVRKYQIAETHKRNKDEDEDGDEDGDESKHRGSLRGSMKYSRSPDKTKTNIKRLRKHLRSLFKLNDDPFYPYRRFGAWRPKFKITATDP